MSRKSNSPIVIGLLHMHHKCDDLKEEEIEATAKVRKFLEKKAKDGKKRTVFLEGPKIEDKIDDIDRKYFGNRDPFLAVRDAAKKYGWKVVGLDKHSHLNAYLSAELTLRNAMAFAKETGQKLPREEIDLRNYLIYNLRERHWAILVRQKAGPLDLVIMHPGHIKGFLQESGILEKNVVRLSKDIIPNQRRLFEGLDKALGNRRLNRKRLEMLNRRRQRDRKKRELLKRVVAAWLQ